VQWRGVSWLSKNSFDENIDSRLHIGEPSLRRHSPVLLLLIYFLLAMPAAAASRIETDIAELIVPNVAELNLPDTTPVLPGQPTDADEPPEPLENGKPRRWAEFGCAASSVSDIGLLRRQGGRRRARCGTTPTLR
jgi:hypothetical protein